jgi:TrwC relaxase
MLRITTSHSPEAAKNYFDVALKTSDYYTKDIGTWGGKGAEILGLKGDVQRKDFVALANNRWPGANGRRLTARMNKIRLEDVIDKTGVPTIDSATGTVKKREVSNRRAGYDFTWKALEVGNTVGDRTFYEAHFHHLLATKLEACGYGIRRTEHHFELSSVSQELVEKFSKRTKLIEQRARERYTVLEAEARALMRSTNMAFDDAFAYIIAEIGGDWDKWKSDLGARDRESKSSTKYKARQELVAHWQSEMTPEERESLQPQCVKSAPSQNLLGAGAAKELAIQHLFEQVSLKRELHIAGMLLRRGIARVSIAEALAWIKSDPSFVRPDPDGKLLTTREVRDAENKMIHLAAQGQGKHEALGGGTAWIIRHPLVGASKEQSKAVRHVLGSEDFVISFKGPAGAGKTELMT